MEEQELTEKIIGCAMNVHPAHPVETSFWLLPRCFGGVRLFARVPYQRQHFTIVCELDNDTCPTDSPAAIGLGQDGQRWDP